jgi:hypothetical protein
MKKRRQPLIIIITHAGEDDEGICYEEYEYAKKRALRHRHDADVAAGDLRGVARRRLDSPASGAG